MDILIHTLSGALVGSLVGNVAQNKRAIQRFSMVLLGAVAGAMPDLDAISMWSGFDSSFGSWFSLSESGRQIFFGKHWYSHHGFSHSLLSALLLTTAYAGLRKLILRQNVKTGIAYYLAFFFGYVSHLLGDLPTPPGSWGGIDLFYPFGPYVGGWAWTWWWNNYDIFLLLLCGVVFNLILISVNKWFMKWGRKTSMAATSLVLVLCLAQFYFRGPKFEYIRGNNEFGSMEQRSLAIQKRALGDSLFEKMRKFDNSVSVNF